MPDHGPSLDEHIPSQNRLEFRKLASREADALTISNVDVSALLKGTVTFAAPGTSSRLGTHQVSIKFD